MPQMVTDNYKKTPMDSRAGSMAGYRERVDSGVSRGIPPDKRFSDMKST